MVVGLLFEAIQITLLDLIVGAGIVLVLGTIVLIGSAARDLDQEFEETSEPEVVPAFDFKLWDRPRAESDLGDAPWRQAA